MTNDPLLIAKRIEGMSTATLLTLAFLLKRMALLDGTAAQMLADELKSFLDAHQPPSDVTPIDVAFVQGFDQGVSQCQRALRNVG